MSQAVAAAEAALYRAMIACDLPTLEALLAPDLAYVHSNGVVEDRAQYLDRVERRYYDYTHINCQDEVRTVSGDLAVTRGLCDMDVATAGGRVATVQLYYTLVWSRRDSAWRLTVRQATRLA
jgi:ketosteroid isomerase-like protein